MTTFLQDARHAFRMLRRSPAFTLVAVLTLALGIGINTTIFSGISALLLKPLPYANADQLVQVQVGNAASKATLVELRERMRSLDAIAAASTWAFTLTGEGAAERLSAVRATPNLFNMLGVVPLLGRTLVPADGAPGADRVVVLSYGSWQQRFGGDPDIVDRSFDIHQGSDGWCRGFR
jgi:hypothetical protein